MLTTNESNANSPNRTETQYCRKNLKIIFLFNNLFFENIDPIKKFIFHFFSF